MAINAFNQQSDLWAEGEAVNLRFIRDGDNTTGVLIWDISPNFSIYNGMVIIGSIKPINPSNYPTDGVVYAGSPTFIAPRDIIGGAQVVAAFYNDTTTSSVKVSGLDSNQAYFFSAHIVSNINDYYTIGSKSYAETNVNTTFAGDIPKEYSAPLNPVVGQVYFDVPQQLLLVWTGVVWQPTMEHTCFTGEFDPEYPFSNIPQNANNAAAQVGNNVGQVTTSADRSGLLNYPKLGDFFYNTRQRALKVWDGSKWNLVETEPGQEMSKKLGVGTNLTLMARQSMVTTLKKMLGWPTINVELTDDQFDVAINNALQQLRQRSDSAYHKQYFFMQVQSSQDVYYLNDPSKGTDKIVDVIRIHRLNLLGLVNFAPDNIYAQQFLNQFYAPGVQYDLVSIHLIHAMSEMYSLLFAGEVAFNWREAARELRFYRRFSTFEKVVVETTCERLEQELLDDRYTQQWIQQWAKAELYFMLGNIRGKFQSLPGPGGGLQLNADTLIAEATRMQEDCSRQIRDMEIGQNGPGTFFVPFVIG